MKAHVSFQLGTVRDGQGSVRCFCIRLSTTFFKPSTPFNFIFSSFFLFAPMFRQYAEFPFKGQRSEARPTSARSQSFTTKIRLLAFSKRLIASVPQSITRTVIVTVGAIWLELQRSPLFSLYVFFKFFSAFSHLINAK